MRGHQSHKEFAREFAPEMVEKILNRAAHTPMVIGRCQHDHLRPVNAGLQCRITRQAVGRLGMEKRQRLFFQVEHIDRAVGGGQLPGNMMDDNSQARFGIKAADNGQNA
jgi:hypothetical protein